jgi:general L-amino acid transport system substrate-binding protein
MMILNPNKPVSFRRNQLKLKMNLGALLVLGFFVAPSAQAGATFDKVKKSGALNCGIAGSLPGFSTTNSKGEYEGLDVDLCRAIAAAMKVKPNYKELTAKVRFTSLQTGEVDILVRNTTFTLSRDTKLGFDNTGINFYDGQGFMVPKKLNLKSVKDLSGASICVQSGTTTEQNLADYFKSKGLKYKAVVFEKIEDTNKAYISERCDAYTTDGSGLASVRSGLKNPKEHVILPEFISREPLGPMVRQDDPQMAAIARWVLNALILAEEKGITQANVSGKKSDPDPEVKRLLGSSGTLGAELGLSEDWAFLAIQAVGNYGEIFERNVGANTSMGLTRGLNALWNQGGLMYAPPFN